MGTLRDRFLREATAAPWLAAGGESAGEIARQMGEHARARSWPLPPPYHRRVPGVVEADLQARLLAELRAAGIWALRIDQSGKIVGGGDSRQIVPGSHTGLPDVLACFEGRLVVLEVKAPGGRLSAHQRLRMREIQSAQGLAAIVVDVGRVVPWLRGEVGATCPLEGLPVL